jgi:Rps23 Pro-64 3,4-dihydroxylase Tpa1-like proline 4-hydroxylase
MSGRDFLGWLSQATGISDLLYDSEYVGGGTHENLDGQGLDPHVDFNVHTNGRWHRRLNLILFLNDHWEPDWGGCLELRRDPWLPADEDELVTVVPRANRIVIFETTEHSWHGFPRITLPASTEGLMRRSVAVDF